MKWILVLVGALCATLLFAVSVYVFPFAEHAGAVADSGALPIAMTKHDVSEIKNDRTRNDENDNEVPDPYQVEYHVLTITSKVDNIEIRKLHLNRGNCHISNGMFGSGVFPPKLPETLKFGEQLEFSPLCDVLEAEVETDQGSFNLTFNQ